MRVLYFPRGALKRKVLHLDYVSARIMTNVLVREITSLDDKSS